MTQQYSVAVRDGRNDAIETVTGATAKLLIFSGAKPADCAAADPAGLLATLTLPADWMSNSAAGVKLKLGTWEGVGSGAGNAASFRIKDNAGTTCHIQGTITQPVVILTNALTAVNGNVLNFADTTGVVVGMNVSGTGIIPGSTVIAVTGTTVTLSISSIAGVANGASITFGGDIVVDNINIAISQAITINTFGITDGNA